MSDTKKHNFMRRSFHFYTAPGTLYISRYQLIKSVPDRTYHVSFFKNKNKKNKKKTIGTYHVNCRV